MRGERLTQSALAHRLGVHVGTVTAWEIGKQRPEGENMEKLAVELDVDAEFLVGRVDAEETPEQAMEGRGEIEFFLTTFRAASGKQEGSDQRARMRDVLRAAIRQAERKGWDATPLLAELGRLANEEG